MSNETQLRNARLEKIERLRAHGVQGFPNTFRITDEMETKRKQLAHLARDMKESEEQKASVPTEIELQGNEEEYWLYGRVVGKRGPFLVIRTPYGDVQSLVRPKDSKNAKTTLPESQQPIAKTVDLGDHIAVRGPQMRTRTGELAVRADHYEHVSKALLPPPEKWHGLKDVEKRYRERYVDLWANPDVARVFRARTLIVRTLREYLDVRGFLEVETPMLHQVRGGATAKPFETHHNALDLELFMRIAPELYLKRLLVGGFDRVYEIGRNFRNEGISTRHNPEFTMLEFYMAYAGVEELMDLIESLIKYIDKAVHEIYPEFSKERTFALDGPWKRITMREAIVDGARADGHSINQADLRDPSSLETFIQTLLPSLDVPERNELSSAQTYGARIFVLYEILAEPKLVKLYRTADDAHSLPVLITEYPFEVSPLSRRNDTNSEFVDRFELFIEGREIANAFSELNDPDDQAERFRAQLQNRAHGDDEAMDFDADYIRALSHGMPPAGGLGLGIDRLVMLLCNQASIRDVLFFPLLRPET